MADAKYNGGSDEHRLQRVETDQILLRRDLTALIAADREILERLDALSRNSAEASGEAASILNRLVEGVAKLGAKLAIVESIASDTAVALKHLAVAPARRKGR